MDFFKYFHFGLKRKYKYLLFGIVFSLIIFNLLSLLGYCDYETTYDGILENVSQNQSGQITTGTSTVRYIKLIKGHKYNVRNTDPTRHVYCFSEDIPAIGVEIYGRAYIEGNDLLTFYADKNYFMMANALFEYEDLGAQGYEQAILNLSENLSSNTMWSVFGNGISFVAVSILVGIGFWFVIRLIDLVSKKGNR